MRYINFKLGYKNVLTWYVLSDVAKTVLERNLEKSDKIVKLMFFDLNQNTNKKIKKYDFIYPADLKRHKNHKKVIMALLDLEKQNITYVENNQQKEISFDIDPAKKNCLLEGLDDIALTLNKSVEIGNFEGSQEKETPWLYGNKLT